jgi:ATP-dependent RNA helicase DeaD
LKNGGIQVIVGTPGRIKDLINKNTLKTDHLKIVVLDEAD